jgi:hypothetical protein
LPSSSRIIALLLLPWVQQWRSDTFSSASKCQLSLPKNWQILLTGCWHTQHHTKTTSASLCFINLPKKHVCRKSNARFYPTMLVEQTVSVQFSNAKRGFILMEDASLTLNNKGEVVRMSNLVPPSSSRAVVTAALLAFADSSNEDLYLPAILAPPGLRTNHFSGNKSPTKTKIAMERKAAKETKQKEAEGKKAAAATCKAEGLAKKQEKRIFSSKAKASTAAAKAETFRRNLADVMKSAVVPEAAHHHKKSKGMLGTVPTNSPLAHTLPLSPQRKSMSAKKRVSVQSPLHSFCDKEDKLSLDGLIMLVSSRSFGMSSTMTVKREYGGADTLLMPTTLRHVSLGRCYPAQGRKGL